MCFAIPGRVLEVNGKKVLVDFNGVKKEAHAEFLKVKKGDEVLVFNNHVIEKIKVI